MQYGISSGILEQKKGISRKTSVRQESLEFRYPFCSNVNFLV